MPKIKDLYGAIEQIKEDIRNADEDIDTILKVKHHNRYTNEEYKTRISKK